jgi:hypothetical protein
LPDSSLAGQEHGRTIPLGDIGGADVLRRNFSLKLPLHRTRARAGDAISTISG